MPHALLQLQASLHGSLQDLRQLAASADSWIVAALQVVRGKATADSNGRWLVSVMSIVHLPGSTLRTGVMCNSDTTAVACC